MLLSTVLREASSAHPDLILSTSLLILLPSVAGGAAAAAGVE